MNWDYILNKVSKLFKDDVLEESEEVKKRDADPLNIEIAKKFHGLHEVRDREVLEKLLGFDPSKTPWCAGFVNSIERLAGRKGTGKLLARSYLKYGELVSNPKLGDIIVLKRGNSSWQGHVGYFIADHGVHKGILVLGGNQNNKVCYKYYPRKKLLQYRRPK